MTGNAAIGEAALRAGCQGYFGYPITPQNELTEYMAMHLGRRKGCAFVQAESEIAAINMVYGASVAGVRAMTSSSSPGISLKQEGISYLAACELPAVIVNMSRGGPGLGSISAAQSDYFQSTRGGGHGDYRTIVLAPSTVQELADLTHLAFNPAELEEINWSLFRRYQLIKKHETTYETFKTDDARLIVVAFGIAARIAKGAIK